MPGHENQQKNIVQVSLDLVRQDQGIGESASELKAPEVVVRDEVPLWAKPEASMNFPHPTDLGRGARFFRSEYNISNIVYR